MNCKVDYEHVYCNCGGVIAAWDGEHFVCERCSRPFGLQSLAYDGLKINSNTGWVFPVRDRKE